MADAREELSSPDNHHAEINNAPGYIGGDRFGVGRTYGKGTKPIEVL